ncbi:MAG: hypothetical protein Q7U83_02710, partial [Daejeonella sp.]|nr:hypothetical protein [Daejeonella sp.]
MFKRLYSIILVLFLINSFAFAQTDSLRLNSNTPVYQTYDAAGLARRAAYRDSIQAIRDSLSVVWIKAPDPDRANPFLDSLISLYKVENLDFSAWAAKFPKKDSHNRYGIVRSKGEAWIIGVILFLVIFFSLVRYFFPA